MSERAASITRLSVTQKSGSTFESCVFDWWATLHTANPLIYSPTNDFLSARNGVTLTRFVTAPT